MVKIDIEMPTYCYDCPCHNGENGRCNITGNSTFDKRPFDCPLKEEKSNKGMSESGGRKMRPIDADALMKELEREVELADDWKTAHEIVNVVKYFPTIEPEQKKGRWIVTGTFDDFLKCSCCGYKKPWNQDIFNFCPNCGAKMGERNDEN